MTSARWPAYSAVAGLTTVGLACLLALSMKDPGHFVATATPTVTAPVEAAVLQSQPGSSAGRDAPELTEPAVPPAPVAPAAPVAAPDNGHYEQLRARLRWVQTRMGGAMLLTPDLRSRVLLAKSAARRAGLSDVGLSFADVYGLIDAETSWVPRTGSSKDGTPNLGIAQFEPATAKALGLRDPHDAVEAVHVAAVHMKQAAIWSAERLEGLQLDAAERAERLREGVSIYYNLSTRGRAAWNGRNTQRLPRETQRHIRNARAGAQEAALVEARLQAAPFRPERGEAVLTAGLTAGS
jgi:hypothetical protein